MRKISIIIFVLLLGIAGCAKQEDILNEVTPEEVKALLDEHADLVIIDISSEAEYEKAHLPNAVRVSKSDLELLARQGLKTDQVIVLYSRTIADSNLCVELLAQMEYQYVYNLGTLSNWPYETEGE